MAPAKGWPTPHSRFWMARAKAKTSRPQLCNWDIGVRKKPSEERGPNPSSAITQPQTMMSAGVRQPAEDEGAALWADIGWLRRIGVTASNKRGGRNIVTHPS